MLDNLEILRDKEMLGVKQNEMHQHDVICLEKFKKEVVYVSTKRRYTVALPFKKNKNLLPRN